MSDPRPSPLVPSPDDAWRAVAERDTAFDGRFVFAVVTTGIYCRPSCPARRPLRRNVRFFAGPGEAEGAGFRACLRCKPRAEPVDPAAEIAAAAREYLDAHLDETVTLAQLAEEVGASPWHLQRTFKAVVGETPRQYTASRRMERVKTTLREERDVTTAIYEAGFTSPSQLYGRADDRLGMTPSRWRRGGEGAEVFWSTAPAGALGRVLVAATERGVCSVLLGASDEALLAELTAELPRARVSPGGPELEAWTAEVVRRVAGKAPTGGLPLDTPATDFQRRVWRALTEIPRGETRTYGEIAAALGRPTAARAVARACATNRLAVVVPCHRVTPAPGGKKGAAAGKGEVGGYRWGVERKRALLEREEMDGEE